MKRKLLRLLIKLAVVGGMYWGWISLWGTNEVGMVAFGILFLPMTIVAPIWLTLVFGSDAAIEECLVAVENHCPPGWE